MAAIKFTATKLVGTGKRGILTPDSDGYYTMPIGGLNVFNSVGQYYTLEGAKALFQSSSIFMRRVSNGCLFGELGHPKKTPGMSMDDFLNRILTMDENNICVHFKEVWLDEDFGKNNPQHKNKELVAIMAKIKPAGAKAAGLQASLDNPNENVCFSIRALTKDYYVRGITTRVLTSLVCADVVPEGGIHIANKWDAPALESSDDMNITMKQLERIIKAPTHSMATESTKAMALEAYTSAVSELPTLQHPLYSKW